MIYADNAATTRLSPEVFEVMKPYLLEAYGNASQPYSFARKPKKALADARALIAECIHARPDEIYFTSGGTESDNWAIKGTAVLDHEYHATITSAFEHHAILHACQAIEKQKWPVAYLWPNGAGLVTAESLSRFITNQTRLVSIMFANNEIGTVQPIKELCEVAHKHGALFHTDAVQALGHIKIDVQALGVDLLSASAHKFNGPKGVGFLYIRKGTKIAPYIDGGAQEKGFRAGTENVASIVGMAEALKQNCDSIEENKKHILDLENKLLKDLRFAGIVFKRNGEAETLPGLISLSFPGLEGEMILHRMDLMGICISTGSACNSENTEISHVLEAIQLDDTIAKGTVRISLGKYNTMEDVEKIVGGLVRILS